MKIDELYSDATLNLSFDVIKKGKQAIIFANTRNSAERTAEEIAKKIKTSNVSFMHLSEDALHSLANPTKQCKRLAACLKKGIAFHHSGLTSKQKGLIEDSFRDKKIKIIAATPTLAMGVDLPAYRVILKDLRRYGHRGLQFIPVLEYMQMSGRAGRPKFDNKGEAVIVAVSESQRDELTERYVHGEPEPIFSKLAVEPVLRTYVLSLIATGYVTTKKSIFEFFSKTFWAHQFKDMIKLRGIIEKVLEMLEEWEFLIGSGKGEASDFRSASELMKEDCKYRATVLGKRVAELYIDPYTAHYLVECLRKASVRKVKAFAFLHAVSSTLEMRPQLKARKRDMEKIQEALVEYGDELLDKEPSIYDPEYEMFESAIKTALFFDEWIDEKGEEYLLEEFNIRPGEIRVKLDIGDWLLYCMEEIVRIMQFKELMSEIKKLRVRVKNGVKEELIPILKFKGIGRVRGRKLFRNGIKTVKDVKDTDLMKLIQILGKNTAIDLKKQVGEEVTEVKEHKRKGQKSLKDYG
jgi:helicase